MRALGIVPALAVGRREELDAAGAELPPDRGVQVGEPDRMSRREEHALAQSYGLGQPVPHRLARAQDELGVDGNRAVGRVRDLEPARRRDDLEDLAGRDVCSPVIPNCLSWSPSTSSRMLFSTLSSGWLILERDAALEQTGIRSSRSKRCGFHRSRASGASPRGFR